MVKQTRSVFTGAVSPHVDTTLHLPGSFDPVTPRSKPVRYGRGPSLGPLNGFHGDSGLCEPPGGIRGALQHVRRADDPTAALHRRGEREPTVRPSK